MTHPALATMVEAAERLHQHQSPAANRELARAHMAFVTQPANILSLAEYVRGLEEKAAAVIRADEEFRRQLPVGTQRDPVTLACDELRAALGGKP